MERRNWLSLCAAAVAYVALWLGWEQGWAWMALLDGWLLDAFSCDRPGWVRTWDLLCTVMGPNSFRLIALILAVVLLVGKRWRTALFLVVSIELSGLIIVLAKHAADRPRPESAMVYAHGSSFPSGHALGAMVGVLTLLTVFLSLAPDRWRVTLMVAGGVVVAAVGIGRVVLNVHYPSDVVAGWVLGYLYYALCVAIIRPVPLLRGAALAERPVQPGR